MNRVDARTLANRENARKSTGPRTEEGKARSRTNAFQHGLAGEGVAWPGEELGQMRRFIAQQIAAEPVPPRDARESFLLERIAMIAWQVDRAERAEEGQAVIRAAGAEGAEEDRREAEVSRLAGLIEVEPWRAVRGLLRSREGCRWIIDSLKELIDAVDADWWLVSLNDRLDALCAPAQPGRLRISRAKALALALGSANYEAIWPNGVPGLEEPSDDRSVEECRDWARRRSAIAREARPRWQAELRAILARRLAEVERRLDELTDRPDPAMELASLASTFDPSEHAERIRRYIRSRERERRRLIDELELHRSRRDAHPNESEPVAEPPPRATSEPLPALTPFEPAPDAARDDRGYGLNSPYVTDRWVRSGDLEDGGNAVAALREETEAKARE